MPGELPFVEGAAAFSLDALVLGVATLEEPPSFGVPILGMLVLLFGCALPLGFLEACPGATLEVLPLIVGRDRLYMLWDTELTPLVPSPTNGTLANLLAFLRSFKVVDGGGETGEDGSEGDVDAGLLLELRLAALDEGDFGEPPPAGNSDEPILGEWGLASEPYFVPFAAGPAVALIPVSVAMLLELAPRELFCWEKTPSASLSKSLVFPPLEIKLRPEATRRELSMLLLRLLWLPGPDEDMMLSADEDPRLLDMMGVRLLPLLRFPPSGIIVISPLGSKKQERGARNLDVRVAKWNRMAKSIVLGVPKILTSSSMSTFSLCASFKAIKYSIVLGIASCSADADICVICATNLVSGTSSRPPDFEM